MSPSWTGNCYVFCVSSERQGAAIKISRGQRGPDLSEEEFKAAEGGRISTLIFFNLQHLDYVAVYKVALS